MCSWPFGPFQYCLQTCDQLVNDMRLNHREERIGPCQRCLVLELWRGTDAWRSIWKVSTQGRCVLIVRHWCWIYADCQVQCMMSSPLSDRTRKELPNTFWQSRSVVRFDIPWFDALMCATCLPQFCIDPFQKPWWGAKEPSKDRASASEDLGLAGFIRRFLAKEIYRFLPVIYLSINSIRFLDVTNVTRFWRVAELWQQFLGDCCSYQQVWPWGLSRLFFFVFEMIESKTWPECSLIFDIFVGL